MPKTVLARDDFAALLVLAWIDTAAQHAAAASKIALEASQAKRADEFKARIAELRVACNSCHGLYQKTD